MSVSQFGYLSISMHEKGSHAFGAPDKNKKEIMMIIINDSYKNDKCDDKSQTNNKYFTV